MPPCTLSFVTRRKTVCLALKAGSMNCHLDKAADTVPAAFCLAVSSQPGNADLQNSPKMSKYTVFLNIIGVVLLVCQKKVVNLQS